MLSEYQGLKLDPFQIEAIEAINQGHSVIVSAPTGTGKTLVADYLVEKSIREGKRIIYTAPIKALSNQKFKDFSHQFGSDRIGIMTGDVVINPTAPLLIMTTEIFRNQVITDDEELEHVSYIIFDEIHWLNDEDRGTVWEESIILAPPNIKILGLSATIANAVELAGWIEAIRQDKVVLIEANERIVPLEYFYFCQDTGLISYDNLIKFYYQKLKSTDRADKSPLFSPTSHLDLIKTIQKEYLPCLYFVFSRKQCADKAHELANIKNFLTPEKSNQIKDLFITHFGTEMEWSSSTRKLFRVCRKGIAYHHAGLLPLQKSMVEDLFLAKMISVLYCTETFSVGINYPVKAVCFDSLNKYDGRSFRPLANHEFFQMSGRAGRRGIDPIGYSFAIVDLNYFEKEPPVKFDIAKLEPLTSQFRLSYNTILNLLATLTPEQIEIYFKKSFAAHSYILSAKKTEDQILALSAESAKYKEHLCEHVGTFQCPLNYYPKRKELDRLRKAYDKLDPRRRNKIYGRQMYRKILKWDKILRTAPQKCTHKQNTNCKSHAGKWQNLEKEIAALRKQLTLLPDYHTFNDEFIMKKAQLKQLGYIDLADDRDIILPRGEIARHIYVQEVLVTELIFSGIMEQLDDDQLAALISCIDYESKRNDYFNKFDGIDLKPVKAIQSYIQSICGPESVRFDARPAIITYHWSQGAPLSTVQQLCTLDEGDIIAVLRRTIDLLRQMREAVTDKVLRERLITCMKRMDRDEASIQEL
ncbi:DEAD/DEAH box helicase [Dehalobacter sp. DCM]|uniref:DEAD/DEAH box helicase n=1 Tax=Dehalobacter sp. DCM TaxID=2907827 RepID=UPI003081B71F|nr:DEAD/DEAH box helicase [Dehalobacter sp. DCM]